jgi:hypothetical protein
MGFQLAVELSIGCSRQSVQILWIWIERTKPDQPVIEEYQGKRILRIPTVDQPNPDTTWHWMSFGKNKAKAIVKYFDAIKKFAEE